ncbi:MAG: SusC/RagA family TonB-linked outer membrane protein, partial [Rikenellaceae bacterium]
IKGWNITAEGSMKVTNYHAHAEILPVYSYDATGTANEIEFIGGVTAAGYSQVTENTYATDFYTFNLFSDYTKEYKGHTFKVLGGFNTEYYDYRNMKITAQDLVTPNLPTINTSNSFVESGIAAGYQNWATAGFFGRINYDYKGKYLLELNARYDGTSRFIEDVRWAVFPSASLGWNIAKEDFFEPLKDVVSTLKLRASWGQLGNTNTSSFYPFYATMSTGLSNSGWMYDGAKQNTASAPGLISSSLTWETVTSYEVGLDFALFNNRLTGGGGYFERITSDMIGPADDLPLTLGTSVPNTNNAEMKSYGWELELSWRDKIGDFSYGVRGTIYDAQQEITKYNNFTNSISTWYAGKKVGEIWGYETVGIAQSDAEMEAHLAASKQTSLGSGFGAGDIMYRDIDGDGEVSTGEGTLEDSGDYRVIGNSTSRYCFGVTMDFKYKWFDLSMYWQGVGKRDYAAGAQYFYGVWNNFQQSMCFDEHMDFWRDDSSPLGANYDAYYAAPTFDYYSQNQKTQTRYLQSAAYVRLKNLQVGYSLSQANLDKIGISSLRFYFSADNLLTLTPMASMFDPEAISGANGQGQVYPLSRTLSLGVNINF